MAISKEVAGSKCATIEAYFLPDFHFQKSYNRNKRAFKAILIMSISWIFNLNDRTLPPIMEMICSCCAAMPKISAAPDNIFASLDTINSIFYNGFPELLHLMKTFVQNNKYVPNQSEIYSFVYVSHFLLATSTTFVKVKRIA